MSVTHKSDKNSELHHICFSAERVRQCPTRPQCNSVRQTRNRDRELKTSPAWIFQLMSFEFINLNFTSVILFCSLYISPPLCQDFGRSKYSVTLVLAVDLKWPTRQISQKTGRKTTTKPWNDLCLRKRRLSPVYSPQVNRSNSKKNLNLIGLSKCCHKTWNQGYMWYILHDTRLRGSFILPYLNSKN